jgi:hypothetical protein
MSRVIHFEIHVGNPSGQLNSYEKLLTGSFRSGGASRLPATSTGPSDQPGIDGGLVLRRGEIDGQAVPPTFALST